MLISGHSVKSLDDIDHCSLHSGVQMNVSYMTGLWCSDNQGFLRLGVLMIRGSNERVLHDESVPRCWYWSGVRVDRKLLHLVRTVSSDADNVTSMLNPCPHVYIELKILHLGVCVQMSISIVNAFVTFRGFRFVSYIQGILIVPPNSCYIIMKNYIRGC